MRNDSFAPTVHQQNALQQILRTMQDMTPKGGVTPRADHLNRPRPFQDCRKCGGRHFGDGDTVDDSCRRLVGGVWQVEEFLRVKPYSVRRGGHAVFKQ